jgi:hypothetical protein
VTTPIGASYTEQGLQYELHIQRLLASLNLHTSHIGGRADGGIDLRGDWLLTSYDPLTGTKHSKQVETIVQCKNITKGCPPQTVRELEGVLSRLPDCLGILASTMPATDLARHRTLISTLPILFVNVRYGGEEVEGAVVSNGLREMVPEFGVSAALSMDCQAGRMVERLLFTFRGRPLQRAGSAAAVV